MFKYILIVCTFIVLSDTHPINNMIKIKELGANTTLKCDFWNGCETHKCEECCKHEGYKKGYCSTPTTCFCYSKPPDI